MFGLRPFSFEGMNGITNGRDIGSQCCCVPFQTSPSRKRNIERGKTRHCSKQPSDRKQEAAPAWIDRLNSGVDRTRVANKQRRKSLFRHERRWENRTRVKCESSSRRPEAGARRERIRGPSKAITAAVPAAGGESRCQNANPGGRFSYCLCCRRRRINVEVCVSRRRRFHL